MAAFDQLPQAASDDSSDVQESVWQELEENLGCELDLVDPVADVPGQTRCLWTQWNRNPGCESHVPMDPESIRDRFGILGSG